jgi:LacI family transcriptional regulator
VKTVILKANQFDFYSGYEKTKELLKQRPKVTGLFAANDEMAAGALRAAHEMGRKVPETFSVVGFDDITMSLYVDPPLTTIGFDKEAMGRMAMSRVLHRVSEKSGGTSRETLDVELVVRDSTGPAPGS